LGRVEITIVVSCHQATGIKPAGCRQAAFQINRVSGFSEKSEQSGASGTEQDDRVRFGAVETKPIFEILLFKDAEGCRYCLK